MASLLAPLGKHAACQQRIVHLGGRRGACSAGSHATVRCSESPTAMTGLPRNSHCPDMSPVLLAQLSRELSAASWQA